MTVPSPKYLNYIFVISSLLLKSPRGKCFHRPIQNNTKNKKNKK